MAIEQKGTSAEVPEQPEDIVVEADDGFVIEESLVDSESILTEEQEQEILEYLRFEFEDVETGTNRDKFLRKVRKWRRQRQAMPEKEEKNYPWEKASNVTVPLAMTNANGNFATIKNNFSRRRPFWSVLTDIQEKKKQAEALENLLEKLVDSARHMNLRKKNNVILYDTVSLGTAFVKIPWTIEEWNFKRRENGELKTVSKKVKNTPDVIPIRIEDLLTRAEWGDDLQRAPWVAHKIYLRKHELLQRQAKGIYENVDVILEGETAKLDEGREESLKRIGINYSQEGLSEYTIYETYLFWDVDGDGIPEDIIIWLEPTTGTFLRVEYNDLGVRPIVRIPYFQIPGELYAMGTGWMVEGLQDEIDTLHNMRIDGTHISMLQMFVSRRGSGIGPDEEFRPLKHIQVDDPQEDFIPVKFPDIGYGTLQAELMAKEYADRATGSTDAMMGFESRAAGTRATSSGTMFLAQQGSKIFAAISESIEDAYSEIGQIVAFQLIRNKDLILEDLPNLVKEEYVEPLKEVLNMNVEDIPTTFQFRVQTTDIQKTEDARRQNILTLFQLYTSGGEKLIQLAMTLFNQQAQIPQEVRASMTKFYIGGTKLLDQIMEFFGEDDRRDFLPYIKDLELMMDAIENMKDQQVSQARKQMVVQEEQAKLQGPQGPQGPNGPQGPQPGRKF